jgi:hypothetical protein
MLGLSRASVHHRTFSSLGDQRRSFALDYRLLRAAAAAALRVELLLPRECI